MNIVFWFGLIIIAILLWFLLSFLFKPIGKYILRLWNDAIDEMKEEE